MTSLCFAVFMIVRTVSYTSPPQFMSPPSLVPLPAPYPPSPSVGGPAFTGRAPQTP